MNIVHYTILIDSTSQTDTFLNLLLNDKLLPDFSELAGKTGALFSSSQIAHYLDKEEKHGIKLITKNTSQSLITMSSGERKKALLNYTLESSPDYLIVVNPFDNLDYHYQKELKGKLLTLAADLPIIQIINRVEDFLPLAANYAKLEGDKLIHFDSKTHLFSETIKTKSTFSKLNIPRPLNAKLFTGNNLVRLRSVSVSFNDKPVLSNISWQIHSGDFWQLKGPNGSGKSTLLAMITGDSQKGYGQELYLFGTKKGSGESVWDIKKNIGYFTPAMTDKFRGYHTLENMLISGLHDSIGLYVKPTEIEKRLASDWLELLQLSAKKTQYFHQLSTTEKRMLLTARAMIKHPPLLLLDEPTSGLDDSSALLFVSLVNKIANDSTTAIVYVSHREEKGLDPKKVFELIPIKNGSTGKIKSFK
ncbi:ABC transporter ATP-binding protein [Croceitalea marina]|uniref:ABC transporter ATP-binding protein n=1 Tax=Croceitalea marina TaxID=1775166 RepID=A0ABW5MSK6_9FLAO